MQWIKSWLHNDKCICLGCRRVSEKVRVPYYEQLLRINNEPSMYRSRADIYGVTTEAFQADAEELFKRVVLCAIAEGNRMKALTNAKYLVAIERESTAELRREAIELNRTPPIDKPLYFMQR